MKISFENINYFDWKFCWNWNSTPYRLYASDSPEGPFSNRGSEIAEIILWVEILIFKKIYVSLTSKGSYNSLTIFELENSIEFLVSVCVCIFLFFIFKLLTSFWSYCCCLFLSCLASVLTISTNCHILLYILVHIYTLPYPVGHICVNSF